MFDPVVDLLQRVIWELLVRIWSYLQAQPVALAALVTGSAVVLSGMVNVFGARETAKIGLAQQRALARDQALRQWRVDLVRPLLDTGYARRSSYIDLHAAADEFLSAATDDGREHAEGEIWRIYKTLNVEHRASNIAYRAVDHPQFKATLANLIERDDYCWAKAGRLHDRVSRSWETLEDLNVGIDSFTDAIAEMVRVAESYAHKLSD